MNHFVVTATFSYDFKVNIPLVGNLSYVLMLIIIIILKQTDTILYCFDCSQRILYAITSIDRIYGKQSRNQNEPKENRIDLLIMVHKMHRSLDAYCHFHLD